MVQLHLFSDASRVGYAAVAYLRLVETGGNVHIAFVMGKSRLAPLREISIPRLELTAAVLSVRLSAIIREELDMSIQRTYYWTDSMSVLKCITNHDHTLLSYNRWSYGSKIGSLFSATGILDLQRKIGCSARD